MPQPSVVYTPIRPRGYEVGGVLWHLWHWGISDWFVPDRDRPTFQIEVATVTQPEQAQKHLGRALQKAPPGVVVVSWRTERNCYLELGFLHCSQEHLLTLDWTWTPPHPWFRRLTWWDHILHGAL